VSKLDELINELCPDGVEYKALDKLGKFYGGITGKSKEDFSGGNAKFITYKNVYSNPALKIGVEEKVKIAENENQRTLEYGDIIFTGSSETPDECGISSVLTVRTTEKLYLNSFCFIFRFDDVSIMLPDFAKHLFRSYELRYQIGRTASGVTRFNVSKKLMTNVIIPLPPLPIQEEIVRILDNFTELTAELTAELTDRKKQYKYYSTTLFDNAKKSGVGFIKDVCCIEKGKTPIQKAIPGGYPMVVTTTERKSCDSYQFDTKAVCIPLVSSRGHGVASLNHVYYQEGKFALGNILCALIPKDKTEILPKYLYYYFEQTKDYTLVPLMKGGANVALHMKDIEKLKIPIPPFPEQQRIVDILDRFDTLCNDISSGLPAEIEARQKQYEYYRDKLLTFQKKEA